MKSFLMHITVSFIIHLITETNTHSMQALILKLFKETMTKTSKTGFLPINKQQQEKNLKETIVYYTIVKLRNKVHCNYKFYW